MNVKTGDLAYIVKSTAGLSCNNGLIVEVGEFNDFWTIHVGEPMWNVYAKGPMMGRLISGKFVGGNAHGYVAADACLRRINGPDTFVDTDTEAEKDHELQAVG